MIYDKDTNKQTTKPHKGYAVSLTNSVVKTEWHHIPIYYPAQNQLQRNQKLPCETWNVQTCQKKAINTEKTPFTQVLWTTN